MIKPSNKVVVILLSIKNMSKNYGSTKALQNISFNIEKGSCFGLVGPNGAGKSTLIKIIVGIIQQYEGTITFEKRLAANQKQKIGYVPQEVCLEENVSALENLYFFGKMYRLTGKELHERADEVLSYIGLSDRKKDKVKTFSGGMKRRLNIGCALMNDPELIMMDEPTVGIDPQSRQYILNMINEMRLENRTIIYSSHYIEEVEKICDDIAFIDHGKIIEHNNMDVLLKKHAIPSVYFSGDRCSKYIQEIEHLGTVTEHKKGYILTTRNPMQAMEKILQLSKNNSVVLDQFELLQPRLEDVFFTLTGSELRA